MATRNPPKDLQPNPERWAKEQQTLRQMLPELEAGFERLSSIPPAVNMFGSARIEPDNPFYRQAYEIAQRLSDLGFSIVSGGGSGIMEAANKGAFAGAKGLSVGLKSALAGHVQQPEKPESYQDVTLNFGYLCTRKTVFMKYASACVVMPGGIGTFDELFEALALVRRYDQPRIPIILFGRAFWQGLLDWLKSRVVYDGMMSEREFDLITLVDSPSEVVSCICQFYGLEDASCNES